MSTKAETEWTWTVSDSAGEAIVRLLIACLPDSRYADQHANEAGYSCNHVAMKCRKGERPDLKAVADIVNEWAEQQGLTLRITL